MLETLPLHHLARVSSLLARGEIVAYPTGTSYALGANALNSGALQRLRALKQRPEQKTYSVLLPEREPERFVSWTEPEARVFAHLRDRPLTLLVRATDTTKHLAQEDRIAIRTPDHPFSRELTSVLSAPVTATSANISAQPAARSLKDVEALAGDVRLYAVDAGVLPHHLASTVARLDSSGWTILRKGEVTLKELKAAAEA